MKQRASYRKKNGWMDVHALCHIICKSTPAVDGCVRHSSSSTSARLLFLFNDSLRTLSVVIQQFFDQIYMR